MTASTTTSPVFVELDPRCLAAHPGNIRDDLGDLTELIASIKAVGVLEPVVITPVVTDDEKSKNAKTQTAYRILAGHRRVHLCGPEHLQWRAVALLHDGAHRPLPLPPPTADTYTVSIETARDAILTPYGCQAGRSQGR